jgi:hypothetical protein
MFANWCNFGRTGTIFEVPLVKIGWMSREEGETNGEGQLSKITMSRYELDGVVLYDIGPTLSGQET